MLIQAQDEKERNKRLKKDDQNNSPDSSIKDTLNIDPKTYCKLGHFHLLLEDYSKGKSSSIIEYWKV